MDSDTNCEKTQDHIFASVQSLENGHVISLRQAESQFTLGILALAIFLGYSFPEVLQFVNKKDEGNTEMFRTLFYIVIFAVTLALFALAERLIRIKYHKLALLGIRKCQFSNIDNKGVQDGAALLLSNPGWQIARHLGCTDGCHFRFIDNHIDRMRVWGAIVVVSFVSSIILGKVV